MHPLGVSKLLLVCFKKIRPEHIFKKFALFELQVKRRLWPVPACSNLQRVIEIFLERKGLFLEFLQPLVEREKSLQG